MTKHSPKLTKAHLVFIRELAMGSTQREALLKAYPHRKAWKAVSLDITASNLFKRDIVREAYNEMILKLRAEEEAKARWSREESISTLRMIIDKNREDMDRIQTASIEELETLAKEMELIEDPLKAVRIMKEYINRKKQTRVKGVHNTGIISAVAELNKMSGFNEETLNVASTVIFAKEEELED